MILKQEDIDRVNEAFAKVAMSLREAVEVFMDSFSKYAADLYSIIFPTDEQLRVLATAREWHLMNNAKKYRTRNKYRNRLIKRYLNETQKGVNP